MVINNKANALREHDRLRNPHRGPVSDRLPGGDVESRKWGRNSEVVDLDVEIHPPGSQLAI